MVSKHTQPLVSIIIPVSEAGEDLSKCLDSVLGQTYSPLEVIIVSCGSNGNINKIILGKQQEHNNIRLIDLSYNQGLFRARLEGFKAATGKYVVSVGGDDSISVDYIRTMVEIADENNSDIVSPETVIENGKERLIFNLANDLPFTYLIGEECMRRFFEQAGDNYIWYRAAAPLYSKRLVELATPHLSNIEEDIAMGEDIFFSMVFWSYAKRVDYARTAYYYQHTITNTAAENADVLKRRLSSMNDVSIRAKEFLKARGSYEAYEKELTSWMNAYSLELRNLIQSLSESDTVKRELCELIKFGNEQWYKKTPSRFFENTTEFNEGLEDLKRKILDSGIDLVSFDIFDTLITRPFLKPSDLFFVLDEEFKQLDDQFRLESFHNIRIKSEELARLEEHDGEDVTLSQIYGVMQREYCVEKDVAQKVLASELDFETTFCRQRESAKELYDLAVYLGKKVIITSDIYLPKEAIEDILSNCGYKGHHGLYISSYCGTMKITQNLYRYVATELNVLPKNILHIGDNYESDVIAANGAGWNGAHFPRATEVVPGLFNRMFGTSESYARSHLGISAAYSLAMNSYFDNPFRSFQRDSNYNGSPYFMGYFALGLSLLGFTKWMIDDAQEKRIDTIIFLSRDGYLPKQIFDLFQQRLNIPIRSCYLPTSRKAMVPLALFSRANLAEVKTFNYRGEISKGILRSLKYVQKDEAPIALENIDFKKVDQLREAFVNTYKGYFGNNNAIMDIGYSGRPEQIISKLFNTPVETYFMYSNNDEAERRLKDKVNIYNRLNVASLREKIISEITPSCIGYRVKGTVVEPIFEKDVAPTYYERYILSEIQRGAYNFVENYLDVFGNHMGILTMGDQKLAMQPLDQATITPLSVDKEMFRGLVHEDDIAGDKAIDLFDEFYASLDPPTSQILREGDSLRLELESHMSIKRSARLLLGNIKRRIMYGKNR